MPYLYVNRTIPNKILLHSLPGCGKSLFVQAIAGQTKRALISASPSALGSKYQGQSEKMIRALFQLAVMNAPSILFLDEIDSLCTQRSSADSESSRRVKNEILVQID